MRLQPQGSRESGIDTRDAVALSGLGRSLTSRFRRLPDIGLFAIGSGSAAAGLTCLALWASARPLFGDGQLILEAGNRLVAGQPLYPGSYLYPPLAAVLGRMLDLLPNVLWLLAGLRVAAIAALAWVGFGTTPRQKAAAVLVAVTCIPVVQDFVYGNESTWLTFGVVMVWWRRDAVWSGVPLGILVALFAKPQLIPLLLWMLVWRRRALLGTVTAGAMATIVGVAIAGPASYLTWLNYDQSQSGLLSRQFAGNLSVAALTGMAWPIVAAASFALFLVGLWRLREHASGALALVCGVLILPYAGPYSLVPMIAALRYPSDDTGSAAR